MSEAIEIMPRLDLWGDRMTRDENIQILHDTLSIFQNGKYKKEGKTIRTKLSQKKLRECHVYLPENVQDIMDRKDFDHVYGKDGVEVRCKNIDSFGMVQEQYRSKAPYKPRFFFAMKPTEKILVLNFANPVHPGGGVRLGARAQEEDLCRKSSLLLSLESQTAQKYYEYNSSLQTYMGSDAIILTPNVEIIRDSNGGLLDDTILVSVMTCAAPMISRGMEGMRYDQYQELFYHRICGILKCAAYWGYQALVLGAFGCGAFGNNAALVSDLFYKALKEFDYDGMRLGDFFRRIDFAVLDRTPGQYNFNEFNRNFGDFYRDEGNHIDSDPMNAEKA